MKRVDWNNSENPAALSFCMLVVCCTVHESSRNREEKKAEKQGVDAAFILLGINVFINYS